MADFPSDDPHQWYEVSALYCLSCRRFEFAGVGGGGEGDGGDGTAAATAAAAAAAATAAATAAGERGAVTRPSDALMAASVHALKALKALKCSRSPLDTSSEAATNAALPTPDTSFDGVGAPGPCSMSPATPPRGPYKPPPFHHRTVRRRHCVNTPTLCCLPEPGAGPHLRCPAAPTSTRSLRAKGCRRCRAAPSSLELLRLRVQQGEIQYGLDAFENLPDKLRDIDHSLLVCSTCRAIGFPGASDRLTLLRPGHSNAYAPAFTCTSSILFFDTVSEKGLHSSAWQNAFGHVPGHACEGKRGPLSSLPVRLLKRSLEFAASALPHSIPMSCRSMALLQAEALTLKRKLEFSELLGIGIATAANPRELGDAITRLAKFVLQLRVPPMEVFGCSAVEMRRKLCETMRRKRNLFRSAHINRRLCWEAADKPRTTTGTVDHGSLWPRGLAKSVGVLLRVFNTICEEEQLDSDEQFGGDVEDEGDGDAQLDSDHPLAVS